MHGSFPLVLSQDPSTPGRHAAYDRLTLLHADCELYVTHYPVCAQYGEAFAVTGSTEELGMWDPQRAVRMKVRAYLIDTHQVYRKL